MDSKGPDISFVEDLFTCVRCESCFQKFSTSKQYETHTCSYSCGHCSRSFSKMIKLEEHNCLGVVPHVGTSVTQSNKIIDLTHENKKSINNANINLSNKNTAPKKVRVKNNKNINKVETKQKRLKLKNKNCQKSNAKSVSKQMCPSHQKLADKTKVCVYRDFKTVGSNYKLSSSSKEEFKNRKSLVDINVKKKVQTEVSRDNNNKDENSFIQKQTKVQSSSNKSSDTKLRTSLTECTNSIYVLDSDDEFVENGSHLSNVNEGRVTNPMIKTSIKVPTGYQSPRKTFLILQAKPTEQGNKPTSLENRNQESIVISDDE